MLTVADIEAAQGQYPTQRQDADPRRVARADAAILREANAKGWQPAHLHAWLATEAAGWYAAQALTSDAKIVHLARDYMDRA
jgi:hypothetical protein